MQQAISAYYDALKEYGGLDVTHETAVRSAMQNLLAEAAKGVGWTLVPEYRLPNGKTPDGTLLDKFRLRQGYWEAKDTKDDLETEIAKKFDIGYPTDNIVFEDTRSAVLFQGRANRFEYDLTNPNELRAMLERLTSYAAPDYERFQEAVREFQIRIPELAQGLLECIGAERATSAKFTAAFVGFHELCQVSLNPQISAPTIEEMLVQHLLTERLFRTIFNNPDFTRRNVIAQEVEKVVDALTRRVFDRAEFLKSLDRFYVPIENAARTIEEWNEKQSFLNSLYERFFQGFSTKQADTHGIVYTPQEIVRFMLTSVEHLLKTEFGATLSTPGVKILDPATGTGNFIVNLLKHHITGRDMKRKYAEDIFANEVMLLPYYIASLNIEHEYYVQSGEYAAFPGMCFADTLSLAESEQLAMFVEQNAVRTQREMDAPITVIIGNPPYNVGQQNESDNNKNRRYPVGDARIAETYAKASKASLKAQLYDAYVKFFRWATDRLQDRDGIICFVSNNSFLSGIAFDGMREHLLRDFTAIYHVNCGGNARKGGGGNVFDIMVSVGITILVRNRKNGSLILLKDRPPSPAILYYHCQDEFSRAVDKLADLATLGSVSSVPWQILTPDAKGNWITEGLKDDFDAMLPLGTKDAKAAKIGAEALFRIYCPGVKSDRDKIVHDFRVGALTSRVSQFIEDYNAEVSRWTRAGRPNDIDGFVNYDKVKWSEHLKAELRRGHEVTFDSKQIRRALFRPFYKQFLYYDNVLNDRPGLFSRMLPSIATESQNTIICLAGTGNRMPFGCLATNCIPNHDLAFEKTQCFPFYVYNEDGTNRRENITDWALGEFQQAHGPEVSKWDIFHYVYALLHDPAYRTRYAENLKRELPRIPLTPPEQPDAFHRFADIGKELMQLHLTYEQVEEYPLKWMENKDVPFSWRVEKMRLSKDKSQIVVNDSLTLGGVPPECFEYRLGNRSALEWVLDQYQVSTDKRSGITSDPNRAEDEEYIVRLVGRVVRVSVETVRLVRELRGLLDAESLSKSV